MGRGARFILRDGVSFRSAKHSRSLLVLLLQASTSRVHAFSDWLDLLHLPVCYLPVWHFSRAHIRQTWTSYSSCFWKHHHDQQSRYLELLRHLLSTNADLLGPGWSRCVFAEYPSVCYHRALVQQ
ncbi:hypothetical protein BDP55DRAFT_759008 [Colletotrichum godetiae]|uniref:Uncharacterized protein n=1 Tax=Colletotrichum godetiae TaxID=1209918 RepID=A0AAJ0AB42_9PEZI|nr:uncharacterized protein BDP55DRAFT_759008 [Colletotrichum godetiae]KAK1658342.1 hypothetical protein BDP55DRAFT_759008 [Colletotrichum godetiae]